jgi:hypothetical protein
MEVNPIGVVMESSSTENEPSHRPSFVEVRSNALGQRPGQQRGPALETQCHATLPDWAWFSLLRRKTDHHDRYLWRTSQQ